MKFLYAVLMLFSSKNLKFHIKGLKSLDFINNQKVGPFSLEHPVYIQVWNSSDVITIFLGWFGNFLGF